MDPGLDATPGRLFHVASAAAWKLVVVDGPRDVLLSIYRGVKQLWSTLHCPSIAYILTHPLRFNEGKPACKQCCINNVSFSFFMTSLFPCLLYSIYFYTNLQPGLVLDKPFGLRRHHQDAGPLWSSACHFPAANYPLFRRAHQPEAC